MKRITSIFIVAVMLCTAVFAHPFKDVSGHWAEAQIERGYENGTVNGDPDGRFRPDDGVTRGEFVKMLSAEIAAMVKGTFAEETSEDIHWAQRYYNFAQIYLFGAASGSIDGITGGKLETAAHYNMPIPRWEMAYMLGITSCNLLMLQLDTVPEASFADDAAMANFPDDVKKTIRACSVLGLMQGNPDGKFNPKSGGTRAEAITVINRVHDLVGPYYVDPTDYEEEYNKIIEESLITYTDIPTGHPVATIQMEDGREIKMELYPEYAPQTVAHFVKLANSGFYQGVEFHRIVPDFVAQAGKNMQLSDGVIKGEFKENGFDKNTLSHTTGVVSLARAQHNDTGSNQFFICLEDTPMLDGKYAAFGKVVSGMDVVMSFEKVELEEGASGEISSPVKPLVIKDIKISK